MAATFEDLGARLEVIAEELAELAHASLREAVRTGKAAATAEERQIARARRSVLKAAAILARRADSAELD